MTFGDQIYRQKKLPRVNTMNAKQVLSKCLSFVTPVNAQNSQKEFILCNRKLISITGLGRYIESQAMEKT